MATHPLPAEGIVARLDAVLAERDAARADADNLAARVDELTEQLRDQPSVDLAAVCQEPVEPWGVALAGFQEIDAALVSLGNAMEQLVKDCDTVINTACPSEPVTTHSLNCWQWHITCFARRMKTILGEGDG
jgi:hypothetical protein